MSDEPTNRSRLSTSGATQAGRGPSRFSLVEETIRAQGWKELRESAAAGPARPGFGRIGQALRPLSALPIKLKLVAASGGVVFIVIVLLTWLTLGSFRTSLEHRLIDTCLLAARHLAESEVVKENLLNSTLDPVAQAELQESVLGLHRLGIEGLEQAFIADHQGKVLAHTSFSERGQLLPDTLMSTLRSSPQPFISSSSDTFQVTYPITSHLATGNRNSETVVVGLVGVGLSRQAVFKPLRQAQRTAVLGVLFVLILSGVLILVIANRITAQVSLLSAGVRQVGQGDLDTQIPILTQDELGALSREFNRMIISLREKLEMQKYVSKLTVQMIHQHAARREPTEAGKLEEVAVLFSDARDFSRLAANMPPRAVVKLLNDYLDLQARIIEKQHGVVDKFVGDEVMAIFLGSERVSNAIKAAVRIQKEVRNLNARRAATGEAVLEVGIGVHAGPVVAGSVGSRNRRDHTVLGDVVNVAFRLCALARPGQILVSRSAIATHEDQHLFKKLNPVRIKGRPQPVELCEVAWKTETVEGERWGRT